VPSPDPLRVVTLVDRLGISGGGERLAMQIALRLDPARFERTLCVTRWPHADGEQEAIDAALGELAAGGVRFLGLQRSSPAQLLAWLPLVRLLRRERIDVLHAHKFGSNAWGVPLARLAGVPVVVAHEHTWSYEGQPLRRVLDRELIARFADAFVAVSSEDRRRMIEVEHISPADVVLVSNGIPPAAPLGHDVRAELGLAPGAELIGAVGALRAQKAFDVLLHATALLQEARPGLALAIAGTGPEDARLAELARELGISDAVRFLGLRTDVPDVLAAVDLAVSSSDYEGSPLAVMECMRAGCPIVATAVGGVPDLIEHGVHGLLVAPREPRALADAIAELLDDRPRAAALGRRAQERQLREFDLDAMVARVAALYEELAARKRASRARASASAGRTARR